MTDRPALDEDGVREIAREVGAELRAQVSLEFERVLMRLGIDIADTAGLREIGSDLRFLRALRTQSEVVRKSAMERLLATAWWGLTALGVGILGALGWRHGP